MVAHSAERGRHLTRDDPLHRLRILGSCRTSTFANAQLALNKDVEDLRIGAGRGWWALGIRMRGDVARDEDMVRRLAALAGAGGKKAGDSLRHGWCERSPGSGLNELDSAKTRGKRAAGDRGCRNRFFRLDQGTSGASSRLSRFDGLLVVMPAP